MKKDQVAILGHHEIMQLQLHFEKHWSVKFWLIANILDTKIVLGV